MALAVFSTLTEVPSRARFSNWKFLRTPWPGCQQKVVGRISYTKRTVCINDSDTATEPRLSVELSAKSKNTSGRSLGSRIASLKETREAKTNSLVDVWWSDSDMLAVRLHSLEIMNFWIIGQSSFLHLRAKLDGGDSVLSCRDQHLGPAWLLNRTEETIAKLFNPMPAHYWARLGTWRRYSVDSQPSKWLHSAARDHVQAFPDTSSSLPSSLD